MEERFGIDFSGVRLHAGSESAQLNREISAQAFTRGHDIYLGVGKENIEASGGKQLLAHELTHVIQQRGNMVSRAFCPVTTTANAHLRNDGAWYTRVGAKIPANSEVVADKAQQKIQGPATTWTKAVNKTGKTWTQVDSGAMTFIRHSSLGADKNYPQRLDTKLYKPSHRKYIETARLNWHPNAGEFVEIEDSVAAPSVKIAYHFGLSTYKRINPTTGQVDDLDADEQRQTDHTVLERYLSGRVQTELTTATTGMAWQDKLTTQANMQKVMYEAGDGSKALRFEYGTRLCGEKFVAYYKWVTAADGPLKRIREGAAHVKTSLEHWRRWLYSVDPSQVNIDSIELTGSDLHEKGLGVMFVKFTKPAGGNADYPDAKTYELVVKPDERILEEKLFGPQAGSLASTINSQVALAGPEQIATYKQKVESGVGTLCEKVVATRADRLPRDQVRPITDALKESLVFVLITGLTDLQYENVLWDATGKPYLIDADNALKLKFMTPDKAAAQTGYTQYSADVDDAFLKKIYASSIGYETKIMSALKTPGSNDQKKKLLLKVKEIFSASVGRTVPIETKFWADSIANFVTFLNEGTDRDIHATGVKPPITKWRYCDYLAAKLPDGADKAPGLRGEVGVKGGTDGGFQKDKEKAQIYADFKVGQIPFYKYAYGTGEVTHNGQVIWKGQTVEERMASLFTLFPDQVKT